MIARWSRARRRWLLAVSPEREKAAKLGAQVSAAQAQLASAESQLASASAAQAQYAAAYAVDREPRQSRAAEPGSAVADLPARAGVEPEERRIRLDRRPAGTARELRLRRAPLGDDRRGRVRAGFTQMPFTFVFNGTFFDLYHLFQQLDDFTLRTTSGGLQVSGRLLTIQSIKLGPGRQLRRLTAIRRGRQPERSPARSPRPPTCFPPARGSPAERPRPPAGTATQTASTGAAGSANAPAVVAGEPMNDFLNSLKADLLDRRLLPCSRWLGVALVAALAYAVLGGGSSTSPPDPVARASAGVTGHRRRRDQPGPRNLSQAVAETTSGASSSTPALSRNPFTPLPGASKARRRRRHTGAREDLFERHELEAPASDKSSRPAQPRAAARRTAHAAKPAAPGKPRADNRSTTWTSCSAPLPAGTCRAAARAADAFTNLTRRHRCPRPSKPPLVFRGVTAGGKGAIFTLVGEAILHGPATSACRARPSARRSTCRPGRARSSNTSRPPVRRSPTKLRARRASPGANASAPPIAAAGRSRRIEGRTRTAAPRTALHAPPGPALLRGRPACSYAPRALIAASRAASRARLSRQQIS